MTTRVDVCIMGPGDWGALEAFLLPRIESSMFLIGNMRSAGLEDRGERFQGTYAAAYEAGQVMGVAAHYWNGMLVLQAPAHLPAVCRAAIEGSGRRLGGLIGPDDQVLAAREALGVGDEPFQMDEAEHLYRLDLAGLLLPAALAERRVEARRIEPRDIDLVTRWRVDFSVESLGDQESPRLWEACRANVERSMADGRIWVLEVDGTPVATSAFNSATREAVQVGGVWTPPELRARGYARAVVAASLRDARQEGVRLGVLFTGEENLPAQRAYEALGFQRTGRYRLTMLCPPGVRLDERRI
ncbi:MAG: GNAT family N-acetyltransferase [Anaerolineae bacterium]|nr:GNAT family N-acetyltransferase [Anaerolineae bacterium]